MRWRGERIKERKVSKNAGRKHCVDTKLKFLADADNLIFLIYLGAFGMTYRHTTKTNNSITSTRSTDDHFCVTS